MIRFERAAPGKYAATRDGRTLAYIRRFQTKWIAWDARSQRAIRGPYGLGGSPFNTLARAKETIREQYG
jgi:hypothetical protein